MQRRLSQLVPGVQGSAVLDQPPQRVFAAAARDGKVEWRQCGHCGGADGGVGAQLQQHARCGVPVGCRSVVKCSPAACVLPMERHASRDQCSYLFVFAGQGHAVQRRRRCGVGH